jgi:hypothetical protein
MTSTELGVGSAESGAYVPTSCVVLCRARCADREEVVFELIEIELTRVRKMAEQADDGFLLYLIDIAIIEANAKARSMQSSIETIVPLALERDNRAHERKLPETFQAVR